MSESSGLLLSWTDGEVAALRARNSSGDEDHAIFLADGDDFEVLHRAWHVAHVAGHLLVFPDAARSGTAADSTGPAMHHRTVGHAETTESVALHCTLETATLSVADDVDPLTFAEGIKAWKFGWKLSTTLESELLNEALWSGSCFLEAAEIRLGDTLFLLVVETDLNGSVTIALDGFGLKESVAGDVDDGDGDHGLRARIEQAGHTEFFTKKAE
jgi:hypothetical protein